MHPRRPLLMAAAFLLAAPLASAAPGEDSIHAIVNVDIMPDDQAVGTRLLVDYVHRARRDRDVLTITLIQQSGSTNHFIIDETFASKAAYDRGRRAEYVRSFRAMLYPHLGSPWDERLGTDLTP